MPGPTTAFGGTVVTMVTAFGGVWWRLVAYDGVVVDVGGWGCWYM